MLALAAELLLEEFADRHDDSREEKKSREKKKKSEEREKREADFFGEHKRQTMRLDCKRRPIYRESRLRPLLA
jgi:hypothetical protein